MAMTVNMPQLGESVTEGTIARWLKQPGELVAKYESIAEVVTDKVNAEIPAPAEGSMGEHIAKEGDVVAVGAADLHHRDGRAGRRPTPRGTRATGPRRPRPRRQRQRRRAPRSAGQPRRRAGSGRPSGRSRRSRSRAAPAAGAARLARRCSAVRGAGGGRPRPATAAAPAAPERQWQRRRPPYHLTPAVRMLVREHEVDLAQVQGTGLGGRISKKDVLDYVQRRDAGGRRPRSRSRTAAAARSTAGCRRQPAAAPAQQPAPAPAPQPRPAPAAAPQPQRGERRRADPADADAPRHRGAHGAQPAHRAARVDDDGGRHVARGPAARDAPGRVRAALRRQAHLPAVRGPRGLRRAAPATPR